MPRRARQVLALRPAAVAVHNDRDVPRQPRQIQLGQQLRLFRGHRAESTAIGYGNCRMRFHRQHAFPGNSLYAAKLTHRLTLAQWRSVF